MGGCQNTGVFRISGAGRAAEETGNDGAETVTEKGAVETGILKEVLADNGAVGGDIAKVFHAGYDGDGSDGQNRGEAEFRQGEEIFGVVGNIDPVGGGNGGIIHCENAGKGQNNTKQITCGKTDEDGHQLKEAFGKDGADDNNGQGENGNEKACDRAAGNGGVGCITNSGADQG